MSKKNAQHWYQVNKSRSGNESVENSKEVAEARKKVLEIEKQAELLRSDTSDSLLSSARRLFLGRNNQEERTYQAEAALTAAKLDMSKAEKNARSKGERAYVADWVTRNPDKAK